MAKLEWDKTGERFYEMGVKNGVLYPYNKEQQKYVGGVAWNGLTSISESPDGAEATDLWADDTKYATFRSLETFGGTIEAYTYPVEFEECDGSAQVAPGVNIYQQARKVFGLSYRTSVGSDEDASASEYKLHLVYGCTASPSERSYESINDSPDAITFSWEFETTPVTVDGYKDTSIITIDSRTADKAKLKALEAKLYGSENTEPELPMPAEVLAMFKTDTSSASASTPVTE